MAFTVEQQSRIEAAAAKCIEHATSTKMPYSLVRDFIAILSADPRWTDAEIVEVQSRVIRELLKRENPDA